MSTAPRFVATKNYYGSTYYLTDKVTRGVALGKTASWAEAKGFASQAEVNEFVCRSARTRGETWRLSNIPARAPQVAKKNMGALDAFISRLRDDYTYDLSEAREFTSQAEVDEYIKDRPEAFVPGWVIAEVPPCPTT